jgi:4-nitrophenyl phosphatase
MGTKVYRGILADLDGTMNRGERLIPGAERVYRELTEKGMRWLFLSNNATSLASDLALKINRLGIPVSEHQVLNSAAVLIHVIKKEYPAARVFVVGESRLVQGMKDAGINVVEDHGPVDLVTAAMDRGFNYDKLRRAQTAILSGALFWATNLDPSFPVEQGLLPGAGSMVAAISTAAGRQPDRVMGKPHSDMAALALDRMGLPAESCLVVGDRMDTDILFARNAGIDSALVLTGATSRDDLLTYNYGPDYLLESISEVGTLFQ